MMMTSPGLHAVALQHRTHEALRPFVDRADDGPFVQHRRADEDGHGEGGTARPVVHLFRQHVRMAGPEYVNAFVIARCVEDDCRSPRHRFGKAVFQSLQAADQIGKVSIGNRRHLMSSCLRPFRR